jgi:hypothetical protein
MTRRASGSESRKRNAVLQARFTHLEAASIRVEADRAGLSVAGYIRAAVLGHEPARAVRRPTVNHKALARLVGELGQVAEALRQAAEMADHKRAGPLIDAATRDLSELRTVCFEALGRQP